MPDMKETKNLLVLRIEYFLIVFSIQLAKESGVHPELK